MSWKQQRYKMSVNLYRRKIWIWFKCHNKFGDSQLLWNSFAFFTNTVIVRIIYKIWQKNRFELETSTKCTYEGTNLLSALFVGGLPWRSLKKHCTWKSNEEPWSSGYERRLMFKRSWVRIPAPHYIFSHWFVRMFAWMDR